MNPLFRALRAIPLLWAVACGATTPEPPASAGPQTVPAGPAVGLAVQNADIAPHIEQWFVTGELGLEQGTTLLVFWEIWCPHCRQHMPVLNETWDTYESKGLKIVALTQMSGPNADPAEIDDFVAEHSLRYPIAKENGAVSDWFQVEGVPNAAVVKDGQVIWNQHPGYLTHQMLDEML